MSANKNKILIVGDAHVRSELPYSSALPDGRRGEWEEVKKEIHKASEDCGAVVLLGDNFNARNNPSPVLKEFVEFLKGFGDKEVHILCGNHERHGKGTALDFLKSLNHGKWHVYLEPTETSVAGVHSMMIPFVTPSLLGVEDKENGIKKLIELIKPAKLAFAHHAISGSKVYNREMDFATDFFNEIVLPRSIMEKSFEKTFGGHVHEKQQVGEKILITGSLFTKNMGEHKKSVWTWEDGVVEEIPLPVRGIYQVEVDKTMALEEIPKNSIVKAYVRDRDIDIDTVKEHMSQFDASLVIEQYPNERAKTHFEGSSALDLSVEGLLKMYCIAKGLEYPEVKEGFDLIK